MRFILLTIALFVFSGCNGTNYKLKQQTEKKVFEKPTQIKEAYYNKTIQKVAFNIKKDKKYTKIALNTLESKKWFKNLTYRLWDRQITRYEFIKEGLKRYPAHRYEFNFISDKMNIN